MAWDKVVIEEERAPGRVWLMFILATLTGTAIWVGFITLVRWVLA